MKAILALALLFFISASYGQGTINFNTRFPAGGVNAPVSKYWGSFSPLGPAYSAALYLVEEGNRLTLLPTSVTRFRDRPDIPPLGKYVEPVVAEVPGRSAGQTAVVRMRVWLTAAGSFENAPVGERGQSSDLTITLGGGPMPPGDLPAGLEDLRFLYRSRKPGRSE